MDAWTFAPDVETVLNLTAWLATIYLTNRE